MPPLRARPEDIPILVEFFIDSFNAEFKKRVQGATPAAHALLQGYGWPGNVRELRNVIERAMLLSDSERLDARDFTARPAESVPATTSNCRPLVSTWSSSSEVWSCRRSNEAAAIRQRPERSSV